MTRIRLIGLLVGLVCILPGCSQGGAAERFGKTYYLDGAGNWGFGAAEVPSGLSQAGYVGDVELYIWTTSLNPLVDQLNIPAARLRAAILARKIEDYHRRYPENTINVIALSAGTGVATWAIEDLKDTKIHNLVLLGSSLSHDYDMRNALKNMTGNIYVYYSRHDQVLETVKIVGTIDGRRGVDSIGSVGLRPPKGLENRVVNVGWSRDWVKLGWVGDHADCTSERFVRYQVSKHVVPTPKTPGEGASPSGVAQTASAAASDTGQ